MFKGGPLRVGSIIVVFAGKTDCCAKTLFTERGNVYCVKGELR